MSEDKMSMRTAIQMIQTPLYTQQLSTGWSSLISSQMKGLTARDKTLAKKVLIKISEGCGQGFRDDYQAWIKLTRRNTSRVSNQSAGTPLSGYRRRFNFLAKSERQFALLLHWLGASDIREQFPLWPMPHPHPLAGAVGGERWRDVRVPGLIALAEKVGIDHGWEIGSSAIPYVATVDFMVTVYTDDSPRLIAFNCKPKEVFDRATALANPRRRSELERRYMIAADIGYYVAHPESYPSTLYRNLSLMVPDADSNLRVRGYAGHERYIGLLKQYVNLYPIRDVIRESCAAAGMSLDQGNESFRLAAWSQEIDIDLSYPIAVTRPAKKGGKSIYRALQKDFFGRIDCALV